MLGDERRRGEGREVSLYLSTKMPSSWIYYQFLIIGLGMRYIERTIEPSNLAVFHDHGDGGGQYIRARAQCFFAVTFI